MVKKIKKKAFSLVDAIIIMTVIAVAVVASTPMLTRKTVDIADIGGGPTGQSHGRYEVFNKEPLSFDNSTYWEKSVEPDNSFLKNEYGKEKDGITIYERLSDDKYLTLVGKKPVLDTKTGNKDTLYEEFKNVIPVKNDLGEIVKFKFSKNGSAYDIGGKYILENNNVQYYKIDKDGIRQKRSCKIIQRKK